MSAIINSSLETKEFVSATGEKIYVQVPAKDSQVLPSGHQIGDNVILQFGIEAVFHDCTIIKVHFSAGKVMYDVEVRGRYEQTSEHPAGSWTTRLYNVDSVFVTKPTTYEHTN